MVITRFAPSPTGMLHIGGARTALFNYIFAKSQGGKFLLRIEDTDKERSTKAATDAILEGMSWLGLQNDGEIVYQSSRYDRHREVAEKLIKEGKAYYAYDTKEELETERKIADENKRSYRYSGKWRDQTLPTPKDVEPVVRIKIPKGEIIVDDLVKGRVVFDDTALDDFIILRSDGTPTYMFAVVVDDVDMGITHVIRGDDHLSNTPKQIVIYNAIGAHLPRFGHIPLIHDESGQKMSKRRNAVAVGDYKGMGILPEALKNYLLNLGWSYEGGDAISQDEAIRQFNIEKVGSSPSRFDMQKLYNLNLHYIQNSKDEDIVNLIEPTLKTRIGKDVPKDKMEIVYKILPELKKCNNLIDLASNAVRYILDEVEYTAEAIDVLKKSPDLTKLVVEFIKSTPLKDFKGEWDVFLKANNLKFGQVGPILRAMLIGIASSTSLTHIIDALGKDCVHKRAKDFEEKNI